MQLQQTSLKVKEDPQRYLKQEKGREGEKDLSEIDTLSRKAMLKVREIFVVDDDDEDVVQLKQKL